MLLRLEPFQMFVQVKIELGLASILVSNDVCERMSKVVTQNFHHKRKKMDRSCLTKVRWAYLFSKHLTLTR